MILVCLTDPREHGVLGGSREFFFAGGAYNNNAAGNRSRVGCDRRTDRGSVRARTTAGRAGAGELRAEPWGIVPLGSVGVLVWRPARKAEASGS
jgi:hypothetical protein